MKRLSASLSVALFSAISVTAQYCSPNFLNGCELWKVIAVSVGDLNWNNSDCTDWDQTANVAIVDPADSIAMTVESGMWAGCSVWVDWDNSTSFEDSENLHHAYIGGPVSYIYSFNIGVPPGTPDGEYRMRVIGAWGSDGFTTGSENGYGPCGSFQYGSFDDFTLQVGLTTSIADLGANSSTLSASPNPTTGMVTLNLGNSAAKDMIALESMDGRVVREMKATGATTMNVDLSDVPAGIYFIRNTSDANARPLCIVKE